MDPMSIANLSTSMASVQATSQLGMKVLGMTLSDAVSSASGTVAMLDSMPAPALEASVNPAVGGNIDISV